MVKRNQNSKSDTLTNLIDLGIVRRARRRTTDRSNGSLLEALKTHSDLSGDVAASLSSVACANLVKLVRQEAGFSQEELAKLAGTSQSVIARVESGILTSGPRLGTIARILFACKYELNMSAVQVCDQRKFGEGLLDVRALSHITADDQSIDLIMELVSPLELSVLVLDPEDRIIRSNDTWKFLHERINAAIEDGTKYSVFLEAAIEEHLFPGAEGQEKPWIARRLQLHRNPCGPIQLRRQSGILLFVNEWKLMDGSTVTVATDISHETPIGAM